MDESQSATLQRDALAMPHQGQSHRSGKILLADGNRLSQKLAVRYLESAVHRVTIVTTGAQVLAAHLQSTFDLILMDAEMAEMTGIEAATIIRRNELGTGRHIPIIAMTSSDLQADACFRAGVDLHIAKPVNFGQLHQMITSFLPKESESAFDQAAALARVGGDWEFFRKMASMLVDSAPLLIDEIRASIEQQNGVRLSRAAHTLKGSLSPFCATALTSMTQSLESIGETGQLSAASDMLYVFETRIRELLTVLAELPLHAGSAARAKDGIECTA